MEDPYAPQKGSLKRDLKQAGLLAGGLSGILLLLPFLLSALLLILGFVALIIYIAWSIHWVLGIMVVSVLVASLISVFSTE